MQTKTQNYIDTILDSSKLVEIYFHFNDFIKDFINHFHQNQIDTKCKRKPSREPVLTSSEIMSIIDYYHLSEYKKFSV